MSFIWQFQERSLYNVTLGGPILSVVSRVVLFSLYNETSFLFATGYIQDLAFRWVWLEDIVASPPLLIMNLNQIVKQRYHGRFLFLLEIRDEDGDYMYVCETNSGLNRSLRIHGENIERCANFTGFMKLSDKHVVRRWVKWATEVNGNKIDPYGWTWSTSDRSKLFCGSFTKGRSSIMLIFKYNAIC